mmetsp:Transcript_33043/g.67596  ORF Transcript_33043/g.67596 Transcript_33043/m.67596 type:complete len:86 (+) Transcript_33043:783-1040(+)
MEILKKGVGLIRETRKEQTKSSELNRAWLTYKAKKNKSQVSEITLNVAALNSRVVFLHSWFEWGTEVFESNLKTRGIMTVAQSKF